MSTYTSHLAPQKEHALIGDIYDAAITSALWPTVLKKLAENWDARVVNILAGDTLNFHYQLEFGYGGTEAEHKLYLEGNFNKRDYETTELWLERGLGVGAVGANHQVFGDIETYKAAYGDYYTDFLEKADVLYTLGGMLERTQYRYALFGFHRGKASQPFSDELVQSANRITPHLCRALQIHRQLSYIQQKNQQLYRLLDRMVAGVILLDRLGKARYANPAAEKLLSLHRTLSLTSHQGFNATHSDDNHQMQQLIRGAIHTGLRERNNHEKTTGGVIGLTRDQKTLMLTITPLSEMTGYEDLASDGIAAAIFITDPLGKKILARHILQTTYLLNDRECDTCEAFANCASLEGVADNLGLSLNTVRSYLKDIYEKTGQHSQAELMKLLMGLTIDFEHIR